MYDLAQELSKQVCELVSAAIIPSTHAVALRHYAEHFRSMGAPVAALLEKTGIVPEYVEIPDTLIPLKNAYRFLDSICHSLRTEHPGLDLGLVSSPGDFGNYGRALERAPTMHKYLELGVALHNTLTTGERFWLSENGPDVRLNISSPCDAGPGMYQSHLCTIAVILGVCRKATGVAFSSPEIGFAYRSREKFPSVGLFEEARIVTGLPHSYVSIPRSILSLRFPGAVAGRHEQSTNVRPLPTTLAGLLEWQIEALITESANLHIDTVAESVGMSTRTLQRAMAKEGLNYSDMLGELRLRRAMHWLDRTDRPVMDIAIALGYTDASNFARAFRRHTGVSPREFRKAGSQAYRAPIVH